MAAWASARNLSDHAKLFTHFAEEVEPLVTEVQVRVRSSRGTADQAMAAEIDKQIALGLVVSP